MGSEIHRATVGGVRYFGDRAPEPPRSELKPNLPDRVAKGPGTVFPSIDAAAVDALCHARAQRQQSVEHGGWIVRVPGGFTYRDLIGPQRRADGSGSTPGRLRLGSAPEGAVATFHTHPRDSSGRSDPEASGEFFSDGDRASARWVRTQANVVPGTIYLGTPYGRMRSYDPISNTSQTIWGPRLQGEGRGGN